MGTHDAIEVSIAEQDCRSSPHPSPDDDIPKPADGGLTGWIQVFGCWCLFVGTWGLITGYGSFQTHYETVLFTDYSPSTIAWIGSIQGFIVMIGGLVVGPILDAGHLRLLLVSGSCLVPLGMLLVSFASQYWHAFMAQGVMVGIGGTLVNVPCNAIVPMYFVKRRALAQGIVATGSSLGGLLFPLLYHFLGGIGFAWTTRIVALVIFILMMAATLILKLPPRQDRASTLATIDTVILVDPARTIPKAATSWSKSIDLGAFKSVKYDIHTAAIFFGFMGIFTPFTYVTSFALDDGAVSRDLAFYVLPIMNLMSLIGRVLPNFLADRVGPFNMMTTCSFMSSFLLIWITVTSATGSSSQSALLTFCALYGFFSAPFLSLIPVSYTILMPDPAMLGRRFGLAFSIVGVGFLIGTPIAGAILRSGGWTGLFAYSSAIVFSCASLVWTVSVCKFGWAFWRQT